jgi:hypothetical protein
MCINSIQGWRSQRIHAGLVSFFGLLVLLGHLIWAPELERKPVDDSRQLVHEQITQLALDCPLEVVTDKLNRVKGRRNLEGLEGIISEDNG